MLYKQSSINSTGKALVIIVALIKLFAGKSIRVVLPLYYRNVKELLTGRRQDEHKPANVNLMLPECYAGITTRLNYGPNPCDQYITFRLPVLWQKVC
jgi:hypothetical protein